MQLFVKYARNYLDWLSSPHFNRSNLKGGVVTSRILTIKNFLDG